MRPLEDMQVAIADNERGPAAAALSWAGMGGAADNDARLPGGPRFSRMPTRYEMVVRDTAMQAIVRQTEQIARSEATVLIEGESGTGKEILAQYIHRRSRRAKGPFIAVNCAAIPEQLLESELFGHEKGAFSGATERRIGKFEAAHHGTVLLDEIGEMDVRLQAKLLRVLQEREIDRVGGRAPVNVDLRIIATTNRNLRSEVDRRSFREDLYFRLNVASLTIPPLRQRPKDIDALAEYFCRKYAAENRLPPPVLTARTIARLQDHAWPGNVRELENAMHRAVILAGNGVIDDVLLDLPEPRQCGELPAATRRPAGAGGFVACSLDQAERSLILSTLQHTGGNRTQAASILDISIRALRNKLRDYAAQGIMVPAPVSGLPPAGGPAVREAVAREPD